MASAKHNARPNRGSVSKRLGAVAQQIKARDGYCCVYCGTTATESGAPLWLDHLTPRSEGGPDDPRNIVTSCRRCNASRQAKSLEAWATYAASRFGLEFTPDEIRAAALRPLPDRVRMSRVKRDGVHNSASALGLKVALREDALEHCGDGARVLDLFCGPVGEMWTRVWHRAPAGYLGVDIVYRPWDARPRVICPWMAALQRLDVSSFTIVDLDAFGSPWGALARLVDAWKPPAGPVAIVSTDGSWQAVRTGMTSTIDADMRRLGLAQAPRTYERRGATSRDALKAAAVRLGLSDITVSVRSTRAKGKGGGSALSYALLRGVVSA